MSIPLTGSFQSNAAYYLNIRRIGNKIYVERDKLEELLANPDIERYPLFHS